MKQKAIAIAKNRIDLPGALSDVLDIILEPALEELVKGTETPLDDLLKDALYPTLKLTLEAKVKELYDDL